jgi:hypothetical protein
MAMGGDLVRMQKKPSRESKTKTQTKQTNPVRILPPTSLFLGLEKKKEKNLKTPGG